MISVSWVNEMVICEVNLDSGHLTVKNKIFSVLFPHALFMASRLPLLTTNILKPIESQYLKS